MIKGKCCLPFAFVLASSVVSMTGGRGVSWGMVTGSCVNNYTMSNTPKTLQCSSASLWHRLGNTEKIFQNKPKFLSKPEYFYHVYYKILHLNVNNQLCGSKEIIQQTEMFYRRQSCLKGSYWFAAHSRMFYRLRNFIALL